MFKNMKIEINEEQPLDSILKELKRLGYKCRNGVAWYEKFIETDTKGGYSGYYEDQERYKPTTIAELKEM